MPETTNPVETTQQEVEQTSELNFDTMGLDDLNSLIKEEGTTQDAEKNPSTPSDDKQELSTEKKPEQTVDDSKSSEPAGNPGEGPGETNEVKPDANKSQEESTRLDKNGNPITGDPLKDTQAELTRTKQKLAEIEREKLDYQERLSRFEQEKIKPENAPKELTKEELDELKYSDPDEYIEYHRRLDQYKRDVDTYNQKQQDFYAEKQRIIQTDIATNVQTVVEESLGLSSNSPPEEIEAFKNSPEFKEWDKFISSQLRYDQNGAIAEPLNPVLIRSSFHYFFKDKIAEKNVSTARSAGYKDAVTAIKKAANNGSQFDRMPQPPSQNPAKRLETLTQKDIDLMGPEELESMAKAAGIELD